ncbi:MAG: D-aminoacylase [Armatimonadota bacterium]|nr:D-aminoacylase [Armatimonadota bacterium]MDR7534172.1 D-aminoacylase [Armatimonadota bacterium]MDR7537756.1 D-aminoacylase [Armatimonadota bacterium]
MATFDLIIRGGTIVDGTGNPWYRADAGISGGRIVALDCLDGGEAPAVLEASGHIVAPGFIDVHTHSELRLLTDPLLEPKIRQGVTTEIVGLDGLSLAPLTDATRATLPARLAGLAGTAAVAWDWGTVGEFLARLEAARPAPNVAYLAPHGTIRAAVAGFDARPLRPDEVRAAQALLAAALDDGAVGFSTGLIYPPCSFADADELAALCRVAARAGAPFVVHVRNESEHVLDAMDEVIEVARASGAPLHVSHLKAAGRRNWDKLATVLERFDRARAAGIDVTFDQYPYAAGSTFLSALLPPWAHDGGPPSLLARLRDPQARRRIARELEQPGRWENFVYACGWEAVQVAAVRTDANRWCEGRRLPEIAQARGQAPAEALFDLLLEEDAAATMILFWGEEDRITDAMRHPLQMVGSDGIFGGKPHPRLYGTFPRVLGPCVRGGTLRLEDAVRRMTSAAAARFGLTGRGILQHGAWADLVVFDPATVADRATYDDPHQYPAGIRHVLVNGVPVVRDGQVTGARPGRVLRWRRHA